MVVEALLEGWCVPVELVLCLGRFANGQARDFVPFDELLLFVPDIYNLSVHQGG